MATSSSRNFQLTRDGIITEALDKVGAIGLQDESDQNAAHRSVAARALNRVVQSLHLRGLRLWTYVRRTDLYVSGTVQNVVTESTATYQLGQDVLEIMANAVVIRRSGIDTPVLPMSYQEYMQEPDKDLEGLPSRFLVEPNQSYTDSASGKTIQGQLQITLHPVPENSTDVLHYVAVKKLQDFDSANNDPDMPPKWVNCLVYGLAYELSQPFGCAPAERSEFYERFREEQELLRQDDNERGGVFFLPEYPGTGRR